MTLDPAMLLERYERASEETRRVVERILDQDADDRAWSDQLGPVYRQASVAQLLGKSRQAVAADQRLLRLELRNGAIGYPAFQFDGRRLLPGMAEVVTVLATEVASTWTIASWLTSPQPSLASGRPLDLLRSGEADAVARAARAFARGLAA